MKSILFKIITRKQIAIDMVPITITKKYPVHSHFLFEATEKLIVYNFEPSTQLNEEEQIKYIEYLKRQLKQKYNAYSIEVGTLQTQIQSSK